MILQTNTDTWDSTADELKIISREMDAIHEQYPGKENRYQREIHLMPWRLQCVEVGKRRQALVNINLVTKE